MEHESWLLERIEEEDVSEEAYAVCRAALAILDLIRAEFATNREAFDSGIAGLAEDLSERDESDGGDE